MNTTRLQNMSCTLHKVLIGSGFVSLLTSVILFVYKQWNFGWPFYLLVMGLPVLLTILAIAGNFENGMQLKPVCKSKIAAKVITIVLSGLLILFQFGAISLAVTFITENGLSRIPFELLGYFFLIGFIYTYRLLYDITAPNYS